jgi:DNA-binding response OmpR family regulator
MLPKTILVVEDDPDTRDFYEALLQAAGYEVRSASSGQQTRALVATQPFHGVLLDYRLPDTIDSRLPDPIGLDLCRELRAALGPDVPILLVTGGRDPMLEPQAYAAGATAFLAKPFNPDMLLALLAADVPGADGT